MCKAHRIWEHHVTKIGILKKKKKSGWGGVVVEIFTDLIAFLLVSSILDPQDGLQFFQ